MFKKIKKLKELNYEPNVIFDLGAHKGKWTKKMLSIYPNSKYILFEPIMYDELNDFNNKNIEWKNILLSDSVKDVDWFQEKNTGDSMFKEKTKHFINTKIIKKTTNTLDNVFKNHDIFNNKNFFMKIDCQGAEIPILKGAKTLINKIDFIILELPLFGQYNENVSNFNEHIKFMDKIGFQIFSKIDNHYKNNFNMQIDILFINKKSTYYHNFLKNSNFSEPNKKLLKNHYRNLFENDSDVLLELESKLIQNLKIYYIDDIKKKNHLFIDCDFISILILIENIVKDLKFLDDFGFIPFDIIDSNNFGNLNMNIIFINKKHKFNTIVQEKLLE